MAKKKVVLDSGSKVKRAAVRKELGKLKDLVVTPSTSKRYYFAVQKWLEHLQDNQIQIPNSLADLDVLLCEYVESLWESGEGKALAANTLAGVQHFLPYVKNKVPCVWRLYKAWNTRELPARAPPMTVEVVEAMSGRAFELKRPDIAVALQIGFYGLMRTGEVLHVSCGACEYHGQLSSVVINLGLTKAGQRMGALESVCIEKPDVAKMLKAAFLDKMPGDPLLPKGPHEFRKMFTKILGDLGLKDFGFKPYSLRRGGATHDFRTHGQLSKTVVRGRWSNARTARIYINEGLALIASYRFSDQSAILNKYRVEFQRFTSLARSRMLLKEECETSQAVMFLKYEPGTGGVDRVFCLYCTITCIHV